MYSRNFQIQYITNKLIYFNFLHISNLMFYISNKILYDFIGFYM